MYFKKIAKFSWRFNYGDLITGQLYALQHIESAAHMFTGGN